MKIRYNASVNDTQHVFELTAPSVPFVWHGSFPGARFSKLPVITGPVKLFCFPFQMGVSKALNIIQ